MKELKIGRTSKCDIVIPDNAVSRIHATIIISASSVSVRDEQSSNGTYINGNRISGTSLLQENDILKVGNTIVPWKKYVPALTVSFSNPVSTPVSPGGDNSPKQPKKNPAVVVTGFLIVSALLVMAAYFFYMSRKDELRIVDTWACDKNCGQLNQLVFEDADGRKQGSYRIRSYAGDSTGAGGTWDMDTKHNLLTLKPGLQVLTDTAYNTANSMETIYKYDITKNVLSLTRWEGERKTGNEITLVKLR